jgi:phospho-N-acetylmuramoyl-pentapeptide-transferase
LLYWLLYQKLYPFFHPFRIFRYLTFRTAFASLTALLIALFIGPWVIQKLREFQIGQYVRDDGPQTHLKKTGTPTMGGVLILIAILLPTVLWSDPANPFVWITVASTLAFGTIGFADDYIKVVQKRSLGLTARAKLLYQGLAGAGVAASLVVLDQFKLFSTQLTVPFIKSWRPDLELALARLDPSSWTAGFFAVCAFHHLRADGLVECRQPDRRTGWAGDWLHDHCCGCAGRAHLC